MTTSTPSRRAILAGLTPGMVIADRFELVAEVGAGGMGRVFRAHDRTADRAVALKVLHAGSEGDPRFAREIELLASLSHPGVVGYVAHGTTPGGAPFLAMEWLDGEDLSARLARGPLALADALEVTRQLAGALAVAHARGVVHRDLKPGNVFLLAGEAIAVKLLDFGIARGITDVRGSSATRTGILVGTPAYMSPEQARGETGIDAGTDVFALGCVLFECLTGQPAFAGAHVVAVLAKVLLEEAPRLSERSVEVPAAVEVLLDRMLAKDRARRLGDASAVLAALGAALEGRTGDALARGASAVALGTREERRLFVVVAADHAPSEQRGLAPTMGADVEVATTDALRMIGQTFGARVERLRGGTVVAIVEPDASATDAASIAARCALALARRAGARRVALATGRGVRGVAIPVGEAIDRAVAQLALFEESDAVSTAIRVDEGTASLLDARFEVSGDPRGLVLCGERDEADVPVRRLLGRPSPCVGRERELGLLVATLDECIAERAARAVLLTAGPGVGKSRVRHELFARVAAQAEPVEVWLARADVMRSGSAFGLLGDLVRGTAGIKEGEPDAVRQRKLRARVARYGTPEPDTVAEFLGEIAGVPFPDAGSPVLRAARADVRLMGERTLRAWERFVRAECEAHALLVVLEDVHWGDVPSFRYVDHALRHLDELPLMVLATARPEVHETFPRLWADRGVVELRLPELTRRAAERLVNSALGERATPELVQRLWTLSQGNAFYIEELVRVVAAGRGAELPESVLAMAEVRFSALEPEARRVLRAASVLGEVFWVGAVARLLGRPAREVERDIDELASRELVELRAESRFRGEPDHAFRHALLREAAYGSLVAEDRRLGHALAAGWLEEAGETVPLVLGEHHERAGETDRAARYYALAASQALSGGDYQGSIDRAARGRSCGATGETCAELRLVEVEARAWLGQRKEANRLAVDLIHDVQAGTRVWYRAVAESAISWHADPIACAVMLASVEPTDLLVAPFVICAARVVTQAVIRGRGDEVDALARRIEVHADRAAERDPSVAAWVAMMGAFRHARHDRLDRSIAGFAESAAAFRAVGDLPNALAQEVDALFALVGAGLYEEAVDRGSALDAEAAAHGVDRARKIVATPRALAQLFLGCAEDVAVLLFTSAAAASGMSAESARLFTQLWLHAQRVADGAPPPTDVLAELDAALGAAPRDLGPLGLLVHVRLAQLHLAAGDPARALELVRADRDRHYASAFDRSDGIWASHVRAQALRALGRPDDADVELAAAVVELEARASRIADPELRRSFRERVGPHRRVLADAAARAPSVAPPGD